MNKNLKVIGATALAFIAYRAYKLYELGNSFDWFFHGLKFQKPANLQEALNGFQMVLTFKVTNPTLTQFTIRGIQGDVYDGTMRLAQFKSDKFTIKGGDNFLNVIVDLSSEYVAQSLIPSILSRLLPVYRINLTTIFPFGIRYTETFDVPVKDFVPKDALIFFR
jgi:hypothetical protein